MGSPRKQDAPYPLSSSTPTPQPLSTWTKNGCMSVVCPYRPPAKATANESGGFERAQLSLVSPPRGENLAEYLQYLQYVGLFRTGG